ncbi:MAG: 3-deoxy-7-phosphoheptulonate synthase, partial [Erysipelotrichaceae bacterium]|nr:3-deoxy-7-phosphoheptulonate synthase [Erysipelotrichaceae bacterium]
MIITLHKDAPKQDVDKLIKRFEDMDLQVTTIIGEKFNVFGLVGDTSRIDEKTIQANPIVYNVQRVAQPYKLANRMFHPEDTIIDVGGIQIGGNKIVLMAGPCSVENEEQICRIAREVKEAGADIIRGGAYKPRTSPYAFQG